MSEEVEIVTLNMGQELSVILDVGDSVVLEVLNGSAFSFGWQLPDRKRVSFRDQSFSVSTGDGCSVRLSGTYNSFYVGSFQTNLPLLIRQLLGEVESQKAPVTFVVGAPGSGKTSICKEICNSIWAIRRTCFYVSTDPSQAPFCPQGCVGAIPITFPVDNHGFPITDPLCYWFGRLNMDKVSEPLYLGQLGELSNHLKERRKQEGPQDGGLIIDFPSITSKAKSAATIEVLKKAIEMFGATNVIVVGNDELYTLLRSKYTDIKIDNMPRMPGAQSLSAVDKKKIRSSDTRRYFYGDGQPDLLPTTHIISKGDAELYSLGPLSIISESLMPLETELPDPKVGSLISFVPTLVESILAVVNPAARSDLWKQNVIGFLHVVEMHEKGNQMNVLKPSHEPIPSKVFLVSNALMIKWDGSQ